MTKNKILSIAGAALLFFAVLVAVFVGTNNRKNGNNYYIHSPQKNENQTSETSLELEDDKDITEGLDGLIAEMEELEDFVNNPFLNEIDSGLNNFNF